MPRQGQCPVCDSAENDLEYHLAVRHTEFPRRCWCGHVADGASRLADHLDKVPDLREHILLGLLGAE